MVSSTLNGPTVPLSEIDDGDVRVIFKIYFIVVIVAIAFFGSYCVEFNAQRRLLKGKAVPLTATTGWIHGALLAKIGYQLRGLPGGRVGFLMLLTTALEIISDIGVAKTVTLINQRSRVTPDSAMIVGDPRVVYAQYPNVAFPSFSWAIGSEDSSFNNQNVTGLGGIAPYGIYRVLNYYDIYFLPTEEDVLGYWSCSRETETPIAYNVTLKGNATELSDDTVVSDLVRRGLIYPPSTSSISWANVSRSDNGTFFGPSHQLVAWTVSNYTLGSAPNVTFAIETAALDNLGSKQMDVFQCSLHSSKTDSPVEEILRAIDFHTTVAEWLPQIMGRLYPNFNTKYAWDTPTIKVVLEYYLNALIMVSGSGQFTDLPNIDRLSYGVFEFATIIPYWIIAMAVITFALLLFTIGSMSFLWFSNRRLKKSYEEQNAHGVGSKTILNHTPIGLLGWMSQAAAASRDSDLPKDENLRKWILSTTWHGDKRLGVVKQHESGLTSDQRESKSDATFVEEEIQEGKPLV